jgi:glutamate-1-semialdehyde aminotransferase
MAAIQFPREAARKVIHSEDTWNAQVCDFELREKYFRLALVSRGFHTVHAFGSICTAHSDADVDAFLNAAEDAARLFSRFLPLAPETN